MADHTSTATSPIRSRKTHQVPSAPSVSKPAPRAKMMLKAKNFQVHHSARNKNDPNAPVLFLEKLLRRKHVGNITTNDDYQMTYVSSIAAIRDNE